MVNAMQRGAYTREKARTTSTNHHGADPDPAAPPPQGPAPPRVGTPGLLRTNGFSTFCLLSISSGEKWFSHLRFICTDSTVFGSLRPDGDGRGPETGLRLELQNQRNVLQRQHMHGS